MKQSNVSGTNRYWPHTVMESSLSKLLSKGLEAAFRMTNYQDLGERLEGLESPSSNCERLKASPPSSFSIWRKKSALLSLPRGYATNGTAYD